MYVVKFFLTHVRLDFKVFTLAILVLFHLSEVTSWKVPYISMRKSPTPRNLIHTGEDHLTLYMETQFFKAVDIFIGEFITLKMKCLANDLPEKDSVTEVEFCRDYTSQYNALGFQNCFTVNLTNPRIHKNVITPIEGQELRQDIEFIFLPKKGGYIIVKDFTSDQNFGHSICCVWRCKIRNRQGRIFSREIRIHDIRFATDMWLLDSHKIMSHIYGETTILHCLKPDRYYNWRTDYTSESVAMTPHLHFFPQFQWSVCNDRLFKDCQDILKLSNDKWGLAIHPLYGSLFLSFIPPEDQNKLEGKWFKCSVKDHDIRRYVKPFKYLFDNKFKKLEINTYFTHGIHVLTRTFLWYDLYNADEGDKRHTLDVYQACDTKFTLAIPISGWTNETSVKWYMGNKEITSLKGDEKSQGNCFLVSYTNYPVCQGPIEKDVTIFLNVQRKNTKYDTTLVLRPRRTTYFYDHMPPQITAYQPIQIFAMQGTDAEFECHYNNNAMLHHFFRKSTRMTDRHFYIRGEKIFSSKVMKQKGRHYKGFLKRQIQLLNKKYSEVMSPIDLDMTLTPENEKTLLTVKVKNVSYGTNENDRSNFYALCADGLEFPTQKHRFHSLYHIYFWALPKSETTGITVKTYGHHDLAIFCLDIDNLIELQNAGTKVDCNWEIDGASSTGVDIPDNAREPPYECIIGFKISHLSRHNPGNLKVTAKLINPMVQKNHKNYKIIDFKAQTFAAIRRVAGD